jgi:hypothetical protein
MVSFLFLYPVWVRPVKRFVLLPNMGYLNAMNLNQYLLSTKTTSRQFATAAKVSLYAVRKWRQGCRTPRPLSIKKIQVLTNGKVKPKDWYL